MHIKTYRDFLITGHRDHAFAQHESGAEYEGDLYSVETAIDRYYEDQWREYVTEVGAALEKLDATLDQIDAMRIDERAA